MSKKFVRNLKAYSHLVNNKNVRLVSFTFQTSSEQGKNILDVEPRKYFLRSSSSLSYLSQYGLVVAVVAIIQTNYHPFGPENVFFRDLGSPQ